MEWIGWAEENYLRRFCRAGEMHRRGIDGHEETSASDDGREGEQIKAARVIDDRNAQVPMNGGNVRPLERAVSAR